MGNFCPKVTSNFKVMAEMNKIDYGFYEVKLFEGEMNSEWFLKMSPMAGV